MTHSLKSLFIGALSVTLSLSFADVSAQYGQGGDQGHWASENYGYYGDSSDGNWALEQTTYGNYYQDDSNHSYQANQYAQSQDDSSPSNQPNQYAQSQDEQHESQDVAYVIDVRKEAKPYNHLQTPRTIHGISQE